MAALLEKLEKGEVVSREASAEMIAILKRQQFHDGIGRTLAGVPIANKTGALDRLRSDVAIVYSDRGRVAMAITGGRVARRAEGIERSMAGHPVHGAQFVRFVLNGGVPP
jgi:hypothetical protein